MQSADDLVLPVAQMGVCHEGGDTVLTGDAPPLEGVGVPVVYAYQERLAPRFRVIAAVIVDGYLLQRRLL